MARLRRLTSREVLRILRGFGFEIVSIRGSHAKLVRVTASGERQVLTVPVHSPNCRSARSGRSTGRLPGSSIAQNYSANSIPVEPRQRPAVLGRGYFRNSIFCTTMSRSGPVTVTFRAQMPYMSSFIRKP